MRRPFVQFRISGICAELDCKEDSPSIPIVFMRKTRFLRKTRFPLGAPFSRLYSVSSLVLIVAVVALFLLKPQMQK